MIFSGRCYERESIPFKALDCWIDSLVTYLRRQPEACLKRMLPEDITGLVPDLSGPQPGGDDSPDAVDREPVDDGRKTSPPGLWRTARPVAGDLARDAGDPVYRRPAVGRCRQPVGFRADLHARRTATFALPGKLPQRRTRRQSVFEWLEQACEKVEETRSTWRRCPRVEARDLIVRLEPAAATVAAEELDRVYAQSGGNPYFLWQLIEGFDREQNCFRPVPLQEMISERLDRLPSEARPLLEMLAVAGHDLATSEVELLSGLEEKPYTALARMRNEKLVRLWGTGDGQRVDVFHDKIRETVLEQLDESTRKAMAPADWRGAGTSRRDGRQDLS